MKYRYALFIQLFVMFSIFSLGCAKASENETNTASLPLTAAQMPPSFDQENYSGLPMAAMDYIPRLSALTDAERTQLFSELSTGKLDTLKSRFGDNGVLFFKAMRRIDGYRENGNPTVERLQAIYDQARTGNLEQLYKFWSQPVIPGFSLRWKAGLEPKTVNGRKLMGDVVTGTNWPDTLHMEPAMIDPRGAISTVPNSVPVQTWKKRLDGTYEIWFDVTDIKAPKGTKIFLMSSFIDPVSKARRYVKPQPKLAFGQAPDVLFLEF